jgi:hypothetical protein
VVFGARTTRLAVAAAPGMPFVEVSALVESWYVPAAAGPVTVTENWHIQLTGSGAPERVIVFPPLVANVPVVVPSSQTLVELSATVRPAGSVSVKARPARSMLFVSGLYSVKVSVEVPLSAMLAGLNAIEIVGAQPTVTLAVAVPPAPPSFEVMAPVVSV